MSKLKVYEYCWEAGYTWSKTYAVKVVARTRKEALRKISKEFKVPISRLKTRCNVETLKNGTFFFRELW